MACCPPSDQDVLALDTFRDEASSLGYSFVFSHSGKPQLSFLGLWAPQMCVLLTWDQPYPAAYVPDSTEERHQTPA